MSLRPTSPYPAFLSGGGHMGARMRAHDWSASPLGWPEAWPQWLRSAVSLMLGSKFPMFVASGPNFGFLYNDAYSAILGDKHPAALGQRFQDIWSEIWSDLLPLVDAAMAGEATWAENLPLTMRRRGYDAPGWHRRIPTVSPQPMTAPVVSVAPDVDRSATAVDDHREQVSDGPGHGRKHQRGLLGVVRHRIG
ncbi:hypothetical protein MKK55_25165, partial [Methylobacterium sp. J-059]|nr:hypothetical protein [Methylobacterium sp. J-059]